jgi:hypothetical protein
MTTPPAWLPQLLTIRTANPGQLMDKRLVVRHPGTANRPTWSAA